MIARLNSPFVKGFVKDFLVTLGAGVVALQFAPTSLRETVDGFSILGFAALRAFAISGFSFGLRWASS